jgi:phosphoadenosine phosphosulfate reductase
VELNVDNNSLDPDGADEEKTLPHVGPESPPQDLAAWALRRFADRRTVITTQFGMEGCALIDMCARAGVPLSVIYLDTMFLFPETYELRDRFIARYPHLTFENRGTTLTPEQQEAQHGPELWKRDPDLCCRLRKVTPMQAVMREVDVWLTGLRRGQSASRANLQTIEWDWRHQVLKVNPLAAWSRTEVWDYIQANNVPYNPLHEQGYPTVGCTHCTKAVPGASVTDYSRAGRWAGTTKTECGLHGDGI